MSGHYITHTKINTICLCAVTGKHIFKSTMLKSYEIDSQFAHEYETKGPKTTFVIKLNVKYIDIN